MIRVAAVGDVHAGLDSKGRIAPHLEHVNERADLFLLAGDLTRIGDPEEAAVLASELADVEIPTAAVLGNHDFHLDRADAISGALEGAGVTMLETSSMTVDVDGKTVAVVGAKGFCGGFAGACGSDFGEPEMKAFIRHTKEIAHRLEQAIHATDADHRIVLLHYAPVEDTLAGERLEIYPFLGSYLLAEVIDRSGADLILHGHAHGGTEKGVTARGIHVRNVAQPVIKRAYSIYCLSTEDDFEC